MLITVYEKSIMFFIRDDMKVNVSEISWLRIFNGHFR